MNRTRTIQTPATRAFLLLALAAVLALGLVTAAGGPASAFVDETDDEAAETQAEPEPTGEQEPAPEGGVDAGFGGAAESGGLGAPHAAAVGLLGLALSGHLAVRRAVPARG